jgi:hypothetical protein
MAPLTKIHPLLALEPSRPSIWPSLLSIVGASKDIIGQDNPANEIRRESVADLREIDQYKPPARLIIRSASGDTLTGRPSGSVTPIAE